MPFEKANTKTSKIAVNTKMAKQASTKNRTTANLNQKESNTPLTPLSKYLNPRKSDLGTTILPKIASQCHA